MLFGKLRRKSATTVGGMNLHKHFLPTLVAVDNYAKVLPSLPRRCCTCSIGCAPETERADCEMDRGAQRSRPPSRGKQLLLLFVPRQRFDRSGLRMRMQSQQQLHDLFERAVWCGELRVGVLLDLLRSFQCISLLSKAECVRFRATIEAAHELLSRREFQQPAAFLTVEMAEMMVAGAIGIGHLRGCLGDADAAAKHLQVI